MMTQKEEVKKIIEAYQLNLIDDLNEEYKLKKSGSDIDEEDVIEIDALSQQSEETNIAQLVNQRLTELKNDYNFFKTLNLNTQDSIEMGSLIESNKMYIYVAINTETLTYKGKDLIGVSAHSPIFQTLKGNKVGTKFKLGDFNDEVLSVE